VPDLGDGASLWAGQEEQGPCAARARQRLFDLKPEPPQDIRRKGLDLAPAHAAQGCPDGVRSQRLAQGLGAVSLTGAERSGGEQGERDQPLPEPGQGPAKVLQLGPWGLPRRRGVAGEAMQPEVGDAGGQDPGPPGQAR
jgi:hypothetical protein